MATLKLLRESKLRALSPDVSESSQLEASGVAFQAQRFHVIFDDLNEVWNIGKALRKQLGKHETIKLPGLPGGYEGITWNPRRRRFYVVVESHRIGDKHRAVVQEFSHAFEFIEQAWINHDLDEPNKGVEGICSVCRRGKEFLIAGLERRKKRSPLLVLSKTAICWEPVEPLDLPKKVKFKDYADLAIRRGRLAILSQESAKVWIGKLDVDRWQLGKGKIYRFPGKRYGNVEGVDWIDEQTLVLVSDRRKKRQAARVKAKDESIHIFRIPN